VGPSGRVPRTTPGRPLRHADVRRVLHAGGPAIAFQPQLSLSRLEVAGYEALARFPGEAVSCPEHWFAQAHQVGLGAALEAAAVSNALAEGGKRPAGTTLAINLSPSLLPAAALRAALPPDLDGIEIELTEHEVVLDPDGLRRQVDLLRRRGARLAIDDVGAGHSGLRRVMDLAPDTLKLDRHLVDGVAGNSAKAALIRAVVDFADHIGATVCAEGVETMDDLLALADLDVTSAQGWIVGMPDSTCDRVDPVVRTACERSLQRVLSTPDFPDLSEGSTAAHGMSLEDLLGALADVRDLDGLAHLARAGALVLGCDHTELSALRADGTAVQAVVAENWRGQGEIFHLGDYPSTARCLSDRVVIPVYAASTTDAGELRVLRHLHYQSVLLVPVTSRGHAVGLFECFFVDDTPWSRRQIRSARLLASVLGPVLDGLMRRPLR